MLLCRHSMAFIHPKFEEKQGKATLQQIFEQRFLEFTGLQVPTDHRTQDRRFLCNSQTSEDSSSGEGILKVSDRIHECKHRGGGRSATHEETSTGISIETGKMEENMEEEWAASHTHTHTNTPGDQAHLQ